MTNLSFVLIIVFTIIGTGIIMISLNEVSAQEPDSFNNEDVPQSDSSTFTLPTIMIIIIAIILIIIFILPRYIHGNVPPIGKPPTEHEETILGSGTRLKKGKWKVTGPRTDVGNDAYNCLGYALCSRAYKWINLPHAEKDKGKPLSKEKIKGLKTSALAWLDKFLTDRRWKKVPNKNCKFEKGFKKIAVFCKPEDIFLKEYRVPTHVAKQYDDVWWESKMGPLHRIIHKGPDSVGGKSYGEICACYKISIADLIKNYEDRKAELEAETKEHEKKGNIFKSEYNKILILEIDAEIEKLKELK